MELSIICFDLPCAIFPECLFLFLDFSVDTILFWFNCRPLIFKFVFGFIITVGNHFIVGLGILIKRCFRVPFCVHSAGKLELSGALWARFWASAGCAALRGSSEAGAHLATSRPASALRLR